MDDEIEELFAATEAVESLNADEIAELAEEDEADPVIEAVKTVVGTEGLTLGEVRFAVLVANGESMVSAYTEVFPKEGRSRAVAAVLGSRLAAKPHVAVKIAEFRKNLVKAAEQSVPSLIGIIHEAIEMGRQQQDPKAMLAGVDRLSGILGLGENQKKKDGNTVVINLDPETRAKLEREIAMRYGQAEDAEIVDVTPREVGHD